MAIRDDLIRLGTTNPELRPHIRPLLVASKGDRVEVDDDRIRKAYYDCSDGSLSLMRAVAADSVTGGDRALNAAVGDMVTALAKVTKLMNAKYIWD